MLQAGTRDRTQTHVDVWRRVQSALAGRDLALVQIPSHYSVQEAIQLGLNPGVVLANAVADEVAGHFALQVQRGSSLRTASLAKSRITLCLCRLMCSRGLVGGQLVLRNLELGFRVGSSCARLPFPRLISVL